MGVQPDIVHVPMEIARRARPPLLHWGEALVGGAMFSIEKARHDLAWEPSFGLVDGYESSYAWFVEGGREQFTYDWSADDAVLAQLGGRDER
jgi:nucleoside-diphosphate-sugar epimerase